MRGKGKGRGVLCSPLLSCSTDLRISGTKKSSPFLQLPPNSPFPDLFLTASSGFPELQQLLICLIELQGRRFSCPFQGKIVFIPRWKTAWGQPGHPNHPFCGKAQHRGVPVVNGVPTSWWHTCRTPIAKWRWGWGRCWEGSLPFPHPGSLKCMCCSSQGCDNFEIWLEFKPNSLAVFIILCRFYGAQQFFNNLLMKEKKK